MASAVLTSSETTIGSHSLPMRATCSITPTPAGDWHSVAVCSDGSYGIEKGIMASMPIRTIENGKWEVVQGVPVDAFSQGKIDATINELLEERDAVKDLIPG